MEDSEQVTVASSWGAGDLFTYGQKTTNKARVGRSEKDDGTAEGRGGFTCSHSDPLDSRVQKSPFRSSADITFPVGLECLPHQGRLVECTG